MKTTARQTAVACWPTPRADSHTFKGVRICPSENAGRHHDAIHANTGSTVGASLAKPATAARAQTDPASATPTWRAWRLGGALLLLCNLAACVTTSAPSNNAATAEKSGQVQVVEQPKLSAVVVGTPGWFAAVEAVVRVTDREGHGPDIGSEEWMGAVTKKVFRVHGEAVPVVATKAWFEQVNQRVFPGASVAEKAVP